MLSAASMILGAVAGVVQRNVRRMLAYSSIAHAGYLLMAMAAGNDIGKGAILFYLLTYALTSVGAFGVTALVATRDRATTISATMRDWRTRQPLLAFLLTIFLLSLGGFPPTAGFIGKWYLFSAAVGGGDYGLAIIGVLTSVVSVFFYLRVVVMMYMSDRAVDCAGDRPVGRIDVRARGADRRDLLSRPAARRACWKSRCNPSPRFSKSQRRDATTQRLRLSKKLLRLCVFALRYRTVSDACRGTAVPRL